MTWYETMLRRRSVEKETRDGNIVLRSDAGESKKGFSATATPQKVMVRAMRNVTEPARPSSALLTIPSSWTASYSSLLLLLCLFLLLLLPVLLRSFHFYHLLLCLLQSSPSSSPQVRISPIARPRVTTTLRFRRNFYDANRCQWEWNDLWYHSRTSWRDDSANLQLCTVASAVVITRQRLMAKKWWTSKHESHWWLYLVNYSLFTYAFNEMTSKLINM